MVPHQSKNGGIDTSNFRNMKESHSVDLSATKATAAAAASKGPGPPTAPAGTPGVPLDSGLATPGEEVQVDPFSEFNSVTLLHDEEKTGA